MRLTRGGAPAASRPASLVILVAIASWALNAGQVGARADRPDIAKALAELGSAEGEASARRLSGRLSLSSRWRPLVTNSTATPIGDAVSLVSFAAAVARLQNLLENDASAEALHARGVMNLLLVKDRLAYQELATAATMVPNRIDFQNDLAVASIALSGIEGAEQALSTGLEAVQIARGLAPESAGVAWNLAILSELAGLRDGARAAWSQTVELETDSAWKEEAKLSLARVSEPTLAEAWSRNEKGFVEAVGRGDFAAVSRLAAIWPLRAVEYLEDTLPESWAKNVISGDAAAAARTEEELGVLAEALRNAPMAALAVDSALDLRRGAGGKDRHDLAQALLSLNEGRRACAISEGQRGELLLRGAQELFERLSDRRQFAVKLQIGLCEYQQLRYERAIADLTALRESLAAGRYAALQARSLWLSGLANSVLARSAKAIADYSVARATYESLGAQDLAGVIDYLLADILRFTGDSKGAWLHLLRGVRAVYQSGDARRAYSALDSMAQACSGDSQEHAALLFRDAVLALQSQGGDAAAHTHALVRRGETLSRLGRTEEALRDFSEAERELLRIKEAPARDRWRAELLELRAEVEILTAPSKALEHLIEAEPLFQHGDRYRLIESLTLRARARAAIGQLDGGKADLFQAVREAEAVAGALVDRQGRSEFVEHTRELWEALTLAGEKSEPGSGFAVMERARCLVKGNAAACREGDRRALVQASLPKRTTLLSFAVFADETLVWIVRTQSTEVRRLGVGREEVVRQVRLLREAMLSGACTRPTHDCGGLLGDTLLAKVVPALERGETLAILPDAALAGVPFGALSPSVLGSTVGEQFYTVIVAEASLRRLPASLPGERALVIGDPEGAGESVTPIESLPGARREAQLVGELYPGATVLVGKGATVGAVRSAIATSSLVHFATHAVAAEERVGSASLMLAPAGESAGVLTADDIRALPLRSCRFVVLAACSSGHEPAGEHGWSLARAFVEAGAPLVVATLWNIDDGQAGPLLLRLHREYAQDARPGVALARAIRAASRGELESPVSFTTWASFQTYAAAWSDREH